MIIIYQQKKFNVTSMGNKISKYFYIKSYTENKEVKIRKKKIKFISQLMHVF